MNGAVGQRGSRSGWGKCALWSVALLILTVLVGSAPGHRPVPRLIVGGSVGPDFEALAQETWDQFLARFWARRDCFGYVHLEAAYDLGSRADYDPDTATTTVRVPGTAVMLQSGLIHEWAHHIEFQCPAHETLRPAFLDAQGLAPDIAWRSTDAWAGIPSEQYAEAVVELVLGGRPIPTGARVSPEAVGVVSDWAAGVPPRPVYEANGE